MKKIKLLFVIGATVVLSGCGSTKIGRIMMDPARYTNRSVTVEGRVTQSVGAFIAGVYQVEDDSGKIYVLSTTRGVPSKGARVKVEGTVTPGLNVMGKNIGTTIRERDHKVRF
jgi:hypothetical protein